MRHSAPLTALEVPSRVPLASIHRSPQNTDEQTALGVWQAGNQAALSTETASAG